jgi:hypothetical protein
MEQIMKMLKDMQEKADADRKADREDLKETIKANQEEMLAQISSRIDTNLNETREEIKSSQAEMRFTLCAFRSELKETIQHEMRASIEFVRAELDETTACREATETEPYPGMMQSIEEHQETPKAKAAVMPVGGSKKQSGRGAPPENEGSVTAPLPCTRFKNN